MQIKGLAEDGCIPYAASCQAAKLDAAIQKDVWHPLEDVRKVIMDVERYGIQKLKLVEQLEKRLRKHWNDAAFVEWVELNEQFDHLLAQINQLRFWHECLWDAVELVDWRSGEIRHRALNQWLAEETLKGIKQLAHPRIQKLAERKRSRVYMPTICPTSMNFPYMAGTMHHNMTHRHFYGNSTTHIWHILAISTKTYQMCSRERLRLNVLKTNCQKC